MARRPMSVNQLPSNNRETPNQPIVDPARVSQHRKSGLAYDIQSIGNDLYRSTIVPAFTGMLLDFFHNGIDAIFQRGTHSPKPRGSGHVSYGHNYRTQGRQVQARAMYGRQAPAQPTQAPFEDIFFEYAEDAASVLGRMMELVEVYNQATVLDLHQLVGLPHDPTHQRWGWRNLSGLRIQYTTQGHLIPFGDPIFLG